MLKLRRKVQAKMVVNNDAKILSFITGATPWALQANRGLGIDNQQLLQFLNAEFQMRHCIHYYLCMYHDLA